MQYFFIIERLTLSLWFMPKVFLIFILGRADPVLRFPPNTNDAEIISTRGYHTNLIGKNCFFFADISSPLTSLQEYEAYLLILFCPLSETITRDLIQLVRQEFKKNSAFLSSYQLLRQ